MQLAEMQLHLLFRVQYLQNLIETSSKLHMVHPVESLKLESFVSSISKSAKADNFLQVLQYGLQTGLCHLYGALSSVENN